MTKLRYKKKKKMLYKNRQKASCYRVINEYCMYEIATHFSIEYTENYIDYVYLVCVNTCYLLFNNI